MIRELKLFLFSRDIFPVLLALLSLFLFTVKYWKIDLQNKSKEMGSRTFTKLLAWGVENNRKRVQKERIGLKQRKVVKLYQRILGSVIEAYEIKITVENFTVFFIVLWFVLVSVLYWTIENLLMAVLIATPAVAAVFAAIVTSSKSKIKARDTAVMDFLDIICPLIGRGVTATFERNIAAADPRIRGHIQTYINQRKFSTIAVERAMDELAEKLGPRFHEFARKAKNYEYNAREGDAEAFMDVVEMNKLIRMFEVRSEALFERKNQDMLARILIIILLALYANYVGISAEFMQGSGIAHIINSVVVCFCLIIYAGNQIVQITARVNDDEFTEEA
ncbi:hypothetical protein ACP26L_02235 [Paenibacillus sp. S-38]|uniref:hypothetical protein n=1 Tax=Paenibacillus sp. S-38 TaxID=3416710 RepID=UPI003CFA40B7